MIPVETAAKPRDAATVVLLRESANGPEILMVRRQKGMAFMADAFVFPAGASTTPTPIRTR